MVALHGYRTVLETISLDIAVKGGHVEHLNIEFNMTSLK